MTQRPSTVTIAGWLFIVVGCVGIAAGARPILAPSAAGRGAELADAAWSAGSGMLAFLAGIFQLRGANWARWLAAAWMAAHIALSAVHSFFKLGVHAVLFSGIALLLFHPRASAFFAGGRTPSPPETRTIDT